MSSEYIYLMTVPTKWISSGIDEVVLCKVLSLFCLRVTLRR